MRFAAAALTGGALVGLRYWNELHWVPWPVQLGFLALVAVVVGAVVGPKGWLAALTAFLIGHALWIGIELGPSMPWAGSDVWGWEQWRDFLLMLSPTALGATLLGWLGGRLGRVRFGAGS